MNLFRVIAIAALGLLLAVCADATFLGRGSGKKYFKKFSKADFTFGGEDVFGMMEEPKADAVMAAMEPPVEEGEGVAFPDVTVDTEDCFCTAEFAPVCCAEVEYPNACEAECAGVVSDTCVEGPCAGGMATPAPMPLYGRA